MKLKIEKEWFEKMVELENDMEISAGSNRQNLTEKISRAIYDADLNFNGWSINLTSLVDGVYTYTLKCPNPDGSWHTQEFKDWIEDAHTVLAEKKAEFRAHYILEAIQDYIKL